MQQNLQNNFIVTPSEADIIKSMYRQHFPSFIKRVFNIVDPSTEYLHNWHIELIAEYLEACRNREIKRLIINMPPRSMKSICVNVAFPAFLLGHDPATRIMAASYSQTLSFKHSLDTRLVISSPWYQSIFPGTIITKDQNEKSKFMTTKQGFRMATSVGSSATGEGGNFLIVDDPHNPIQAASETQRTNALEWFDQTFSTRLNDKKRDVMIVVMQRLHEKDLTGHLKEQRIWEHLCLPAIAEKKTIIDFRNFHKTREEGDLLHPDRMGKEEMDLEKIKLGSYGFAGQMQQNPAPSDGGIIKLDWFNRYGTLPTEKQRIVQSWDTAHKANAGSDFSVCTTWLQNNRGHYLIDVFRDKLEYPDLKRNVDSLAAKYNPDVILIEDKASGQSLIQDFARIGKMNVISIKPMTDKITRASAVSPAIEAGNVFIPEIAGWLFDFETEIKLFPNAEHDDIVDSLTQYLNWAKMGRELTPRIRKL